MKTETLTNRIVLLAVLMIAAVGNAGSQTPSVENTLKDRWGIKGGINISTISFENTNNSALESAVGAVAGVTLEHPFDSKWYLHSGLEFTMKGFEFGASSSTTLKTTAIYLLLPLSIGYKFRLGNNTDWRCEPRIGIFAAYGVAGDTSATASGASGSVSTFGDEILKKADYGTMGGFFFDNNTVVIGIHSEIGMAETNGNSFKVSGTKAHSNNVSITVGYLF